MKFNDQAIDRILIKRDRIRASQIDKTNLTSYLKKDTTRAKRIDKILRSHVSPIINRIDDKYIQWYLGIDDAFKDLRVDSILNSHAYRIMHHISDTHLQRYLNVDDELKNKRIKHCISSKSTFLIRNIRDEDWVSYFSDPSSHAERVRYIFSRPYINGNIRKRITTILEQNFPQSPSRQKNLSLCKNYQASVQNEQALLLMEGTYSEQSHQLVHEFTQQLESNTPQSSNQNEEIERLLNESIPDEIVSQILELEEILQQPFGLEQIDRGVQELAQWLESDTHSLESILNDPLPTESISQVLELEEQIKSLNETHAIHQTQVPPAPHEQAARPVQTQQGGIATRMEFFSHQGKRSILEQSTSNTRSRPDPQTSLLELYLQKAENIQNLCKSYDQSFWDWVNKSPDRILPLILNYHQSRTDSINRTIVKYNKGFIPCIYKGAFKAPPVTCLRHDADSIRNMLVKYEQGFPVLVFLGSNPNKTMPVLFIKSRADLLQEIPIAVWKRYLQDPKTREERANAIQENKYAPPIVKSTVRSIGVALLSKLTTIITTEQGNTPAPPFSAFRLFPTHKRQNFPGEDTPTGPAPKMC